MKKIWYLFSIFFFITLIFIASYWHVDGFDFFTIQTQHFYFQFWISLAGIFFTLTMAVTSYFIYKQRRLKSFKYIPLSFILTAVSYMIIGYHGSYCDICSNLTLCAASHNYPNYLIVIAFIIFTLITIMLSGKLNTAEKAKTLQQLSLGLIIATVLLIIALFVSIDFMETPLIIPYANNQNLQSLGFIFPIVIILIAFVYFNYHYKLNASYFLLALLSCLAFVPQIYHIFRCKDCHIMECSEFYSLAGLIMFIVVGLLLQALSIQLKESSDF